MAAPLIFADGIPDVAAYVALEQLSSEAYASFVYDDLAQARAVSEHLVARGIGEIAPPHGRAFLDEDGRMIGVVSGPMSRSELSRARWAAAQALHGHPLLAGSPGVFDRFRLARDVLINPRADEAYCRSLALVPGLRRKGFGASIFEYWFERAAALGATRMVFEIASANTPCQAFVKAFGFDLYDEREVVDPATGRTLSYQHHAKDLARG